MSHSVAWCRYSCFIDIELCWGLNIPFVVFLVNVLFCSALLWCRYLIFLFCFLWSFPRLYSMSLVNFRYRLFNNYFGSYRVRLLPVSHALSVPS